VLCVLTNTSPPHDTYTVRAYAVSCLY